MGFDLEHFLIGLAVLILSISLHEFGHAISADRLGDDTPRRQGRVTLWPDRHFDPLGFVMIIFTMIAGWGIGWGKPVQVNPRNFKNPRRDDVIVSACGPLMNLILAVVFGLILRFSMSMQIPLPELFDKFAQSFLIVNLSLMFFNLLPIFPLDGSHILRGLLPTNLGEPFYRFSVQWGPILLLLACLTRTGIIGFIIAPAVTSSIRIILGLPFGTI